MLFRFVMRIPLFYLLFFLLFLTPSIGSAADLYDIDDVKSRIFFEVDDHGYSKAIGEFRKFKGQIYLDELNPERTQVALEINIRSLYMGDQELARALMRLPYFDADNYPTATFKSKKIDIIGDDVARVTGDLTIAGTTRMVALDVKKNFVGLHPREQKHIAGFSITGAINRSDFHIIEDIPLVSDRVDIRAEIEAIRR